MKLGLKIYSALALVLSVSGCSFQNSRLQEVESLLVDMNREGHFDASFTIGNKSGVIYSKSFGLADRSWSIPISNETRFDIASLNKSFVAVMIMQLVEQGKLKLTDTLSTHLTYSGEYADQITIHQMLTHTSGLPDYDAIDEKLKKNQFEGFKRLHFNNKDYVDFISRLKPIGVPGAQFYYSNFAYHLLAIIIEITERKHFSEALDSMICKPLGLVSTFTPVDNYHTYPLLAEAYDYKEGIFLESPFIDYSLGRRIFSTSEDLVKWGIENSNPTLISNESNNWILRNHIGNLNPTISYGYGWVVFDGEGDYRMGKLDVPGNYVIHGGSTDGYRSLLIIYNGGEWIISLLGNIGDQINELKTGDDILKILIKEEI
ncbi:serine hydrolase domain-containing protein [Ekhidna sp.]